MYREQNLAWFVSSIWLLKWAITFFYYTYALAPYGYNLFAKEINGENNYA